MATVRPALRRTLRLAWSGSLVALLGFGLEGLNAAEADTAAVVGKAKEIVDSMESAIDDGRPKRAAQEFKAAAEAVEAIFALPKPPAAARVFVDRLKKIKDRLELEGVDVASLAVPSGKVAAAKKGAGRSGGEESKQEEMKPGFTRPAPQTDAVSFTKDVGPALVRSCGGCHVTGRKGGFQMASYEALMKSGMVQAGNAESSRLVEVVKSGDMPRGGGSVPPHEMASLMRWIDEGGKFDGVDPKAPLGAGAAGAAPAAAPAMTMPKAVAAAKPPQGGVSFAFEIAPVLLENCGGCHGGRRPRGDLRMDNHESLLAGGESGPAITVGKGSESLLVRKLTGMQIDGQRMPLGKAPLPDDVIATIRRWIDEGAAIDMLSPKDSLATLAAAGRAAKLSHDDLRGVRFKAAGKLWARAIPDESAASAARGDLLVMGNIPEAELELLADRAEAIEKRLMAEMDIPEGRPLMKGGCVIYVCRKSYDYSSMWQNILASERPREMVLHAGREGDVVYGACLFPKEGMDAANDVDLMLGEQLATAAWLSRGAPDWFAIGAGRAAAAKIASKAPMAKAWTAASPSLPTADAFFAASIASGDMDPWDRGVVAWRFISAAGGKGRTASLLKALDSSPFEAAFAKAFGSPPKAAYDQWAAREKPGKR